MKRYLASHIQKDLAHKCVLVMGPRQCGKTTLSKALISNYEYLNFDSLIDRNIILKQEWDRKRDLLIFDELHKMKEWKRWLKGIYDTEGIPPALLVTGSARMNTFKQAGDSMAGRHFQYTLHPLDLKEIVQYSEQGAEEAFEQLYHCGPFPEPFFKGERQYYKRWRQTHIDMILRQDLLDLYTIHDIKAIETLILLLRHRVGSNISYSNLARDIQKDVNTVKRYLSILEDLYIIYRVTPYSQNITRSLLKEPKFYFYDHNQVEHDPGAKLENIVANALRKELAYVRDTQGEHVSLHYLRTKNGQEVDFLTCIDGTPTHIIEVKRGDDSPSKHLDYFQRQLPAVEKLQLVQQIKREKMTPTGIEVRALVPWLAQISLR